jgi:hypothetical protein
MLPTPPSADPYAATGRKNLAWLFAGLVGLALAVALGTGAASLLGLGRSAPPGLEARPRDPAPATEALAQEPGPSLDQTGPTPMPADVRAWLEHLERIEARRRRLAEDQVAGLMVTMAQLQGLGGAEKMLGDLLGEAGGESQPTTTPAEDVAKATEGKRADWDLLTADFEAVPPPEECLALRGSYAQALGETGAMILDVFEAMDEASSDPQQAIAALNRLRGTSADRIDAAAGEADRRLGEICDKYDTRKWFSISKDFGGGFGGLEGLGGIGR